MVKDRLSEMLARASEEPSSSLTMTNNGGAVAYNKETDSLIQRSDNFIENFLAIISAQRDQMDELTGMLRQLRKIESELLQAPSSDPAKNKEHENLIQAFKQQSTSIRTALKQLEVEASILEKTKGQEHTAQIKILRTQLMDSTRALHHTIQHFQQQEVAYADKLRKKFADAFRVRGMQLSDDDMDDLMRHGDLSEKTKGLILAHQEKAALFEEVKTRRDDLLELERAIHELMEMFSDLANLVTSQGEMVERISHNVASTREYAEKAQKNVDEARKLQVKTRKKKIIIGIFIVILIIILLIFLQGLMLYTRFAMHREVPHSLVKQLSAPILANFIVFKDKANFIISYFIQSCWRINDANLTAQPRR